MIGSYVPCGCVLRLQDCQRHQGECEHNFKQHFKIKKTKKALAPLFDKPWTLMGHKTLTGWRTLGRYRTQQEALTATKFEWKT